MAAMLRAAYRRLDASTWPETRCYACATAGRSTRYAAGGTQRRAEAPPPCPGYSRAWAARVGAFMDAPGSRLAGAALVEWVRGRLRHRRHPWRQRQRERPDLHRLRRAGVGAGDGVAHRVPR